jgi:hypothetical protein
MTIWGWRASVSFHTLVHAPNIGMYDDASRQHRAAGVRNRASLIIWGNSFLLVFFLFQMSSRWLVAAPMAGDGE